jgi:hypothetical protein
MTDALVKLLSIRGPSLSTDVARHLVKAGLKPAAARKRVSRPSPGVKRLAFLPFPRNARFIYLERDFGSPRYWDALITALLSSKSAYGLALAALRQRGGIIPVKHFQIACGAPLRQRKHLAPETILQRLTKAHLVAEYFIPGVGPCAALLQGPDRYDDGRAQIGARLLVEGILLRAIADWLRRLGIVSYAKVAIRDSGQTQPRVGTFAWDLTAPSYLGSMVQRTAGAEPKPGFVACDVLSGIQVNEEGLRPFINKCTTLRTLRRIAPCLQIFVADHFSPAAFALAKKTGIVPATPENLFGEEVGQGLAQLFELLSTAAEFQVDPETFNFVFERLSRIEGAAVNLRGALFEYLVAEIVRRQSSSPFVRIARTYKLASGEKVEVDVVSEVQNVSVTFFECKGHQPAGVLPDQSVEHWLKQTIPRLYEYARTHPEWRSLELAFELWTTGKLSDSARIQVAELSARVRPTKYTVVVREADGIREVAKSLHDRSLLNIFNEHFFEHPFASAERGLEKRHIRRPHSLARTNSPVVRSVNPAGDEFASTRVCNSPPQSGGDD